MDPTLFSKEFLTSMGVPDDLFKRLDMDPLYQHSAVLTDFETGDIRCLISNWAKDPKGFVTYRLRYFFRDAEGKNHINELLSFSVYPENNEQIRLSNLHLSAQISGSKSVDFSDFELTYKIADYCRRIHEHLGERGEWVNPIGLAGKTGLYTPEKRPSLHLPGLYPNGEIKTYFDKPRLKQKIASQMGLIYPAPFFLSLFGIQTTQGLPNSTQTLTLRDEESGYSYLLACHHEAAEKPNHYKQTATLTRIKGSDKTAHTLYEMEYADGPSRSTQTYSRNSFLGTAKKIISLRFFKMQDGPVAVSSLETINLRDPRATHIALKSIRMLNRTIRAGLTSLEDDLGRKPFDRRYLLPTDIFQSTGLYGVLTEAKPVPTPKGRLTFRALGGNNTHHVFSETDKHIGANAYILSYYPPKQNRSHSLLIDLGVLFHDKFDVTFFNAGQYLRHKDSSAGTPEHNVEAILFTHRHKDHISQLAYLIKAGYIIPPIIIDPLSHRQLKREMEGLDI